MNFSPFPSCYLRWSPVSSVSSWNTEQPPQSDIKKSSLINPFLLSSSPPWLSSLRTLGLIPSCSSSRSWPCSVCWRDCWSSLGSYSDTSTTSLSLSPHKLSVSTPTMVRLNPSNHLALMWSMSPQDRLRDFLSDFSDLRAAITFCFNSVSETGTFSVVSLGWLLLMIMTGVGDSCWKFLFLTKLLILFCFEILVGVGVSETFCRFFAM